VGFAKVPMPSSWHPTVLFSPQNNGLAEGAGFTRERCLLSAVRKIWQHLCENFSDFSKNSSGKFV